jgi:hypothetical protein
MAIYGGRDFEAPTYQTVTILSKCTKLKITRIARLTYIARCAVIIRLYLHHQLLAPARQSS